MTGVSQHLDIYLDLKDPAAYLALPGTLALLANTDCAASWHPLQSEPQKPLGAEPPSSASRGDWHRWFRASYRLRELHYYAKVLGLPLHQIHAATRVDDTTDPADSTASALVMLWLNQLKTPASTTGQLLLKLARQHYTTSQPCLNDAQQVAQLLTEANFDGAAFIRFCEAGGHATLQEALMEANSKGVTRGPAYRFQESLYIGREHLPLLAEQLSADPQNPQQAK